MLLRTRLPIVAASVVGIVVLGAHWPDLSEDEKFAVIAHERAHAAMHHTRQRIWWVLSGQWVGITLRCCQQEIDADYVAFRQGHGRGLLKLLCRAHNTSASDFHPSHRERIDNIRRWMTNGTDFPAHPG